MPIVPRFTAGNHAKILKLSGKAVRLGAIEVIIKALASGR